MSYHSNLETLLYYAHKKIDRLTQPYNLTINDKEYIISELQQLKEILQPYQDESIKIKIRKLEEPK